MKNQSLHSNDKDRDCGCPKSPETFDRNAKVINLAIQGGGAHGAFAWGIIDRP